MTGRLTVRPACIVILEPLLRLEALGAALLLGQLFCHFRPDFEDLRREVIFIQLSEIEERIHFGDAAAHVGETSKHLSLRGCIRDGFRRMCKVGFKSAASFRSGRLQGRGGGIEMSGRHLKVDIGVSVKLAQAVVDFTPHIRNLAVRVVKNIMVDCSCIVRVANGLIDAASEIRELVAIGVVFIVSLHSPDLPQGGFSV